MQRSSAARERQQQNTRTITKLLNVRLLNPFLIFYAFPPSKSRWFSFLASSYVFFVYVFFVFFYHFPVNDFRNPSEPCLLTNF